jgi:hypothetical protein
LALDDALPLLRVLIAELLRTARANGYFARTLTIRVEGPDLRASRAYTFQAPTADDTECTSVAIALLRRIWRGLERRPLHSVSGSLSELTSARGQLSLFEPANAAKESVSPSTRSHWHALWTAKVAARSRSARGLLGS